VARLDPTMKTVLAPIDFSSISQRVVDEAIVIARAVGARLVLLHVVQGTKDLAGHPDDLEVAGKVASRAVTDATSRLSELQHRLHGEGVTAHVVHRVGQPGEQIVEQAERLEADYIVMGSHGHGAFYDLLVGSTTTRVLKQATCAVAVVPPVKTRDERRRANGDAPR
jgi:nucleotide-binding universal stress UspA family protein